MNATPQRILVRGVNWLGDAVMTTPALRRLREKFPAAHIALLCPAKLADLWQHHPAVNEVITFAPGESVFAVAQKLRPARFDLALVLPNSPRSALEVFLARIPQRIGAAQPWRNLFLTRAIPPRSVAVTMRKRTAAEVRQLVSENSKLKTQNSKLPSSAHQTHEYLHLAAALGANPAQCAPQLAVTPAELAAARQKFGLVENTGPIFGLNPGAEYGPAKRWPAEKFIATAKEIQARTNCRWLIFGGQSDVELTERIAAGIHSPASTPVAPKRSEGGLPPLNLAGQTTLRELMALLASCRVVLTNDTGPMHVAAALGVPVVALFGSTSAALTGPISVGDLRHPLVQSSVPCAPCFLRECPVDFRCMEGIKVASVVAAVLATIAPPPAIPQTASLRYGAELP